MHILKPLQKAHLRTKQNLAEGHDINFIEMETRVSMVLATIGSYRDLFNIQLLDLVSAPSISPALKVAWNDCIANLTVMPNS